MRRSLSSWRGRERIASARALKCFRVMVESLPEAQPLVKGLGVVGGGSASEGDVPRTAVEAVADGFRHLVIDVSAVHLVGQVALDAVETLLDGIEASLHRGVAHGVVLGAWLARQSLVDGFSNDGDESVFEGGCESLGEEAGDGVVHGVWWCGCLVGGVVDDEMTIPHPQGWVKGWPES